jgi:hypothetical protein
MTLYFPPRLKLYLYETTQLLIPFALRHAHSAQLNWQYTAGSVTMEQKFNNRVRGNLNSLSWVLWRNSGHAWLFPHKFTWLNALNAELNPICHLLALLEAHPILHFSGIRVKASCIVVSNLGMCSSRTDFETLRA